MGYIRESSLRRRAAKEGRKDRLAEGAEAQAQCSETRAKCYFVGVEGTKRGRHVGSVSRGWLWIFGLPSQPTTEIERERKETRERDRQGIPTFAPYTETPFSLSSFCPVFSRSLFPEKLSRISNHPSLPFIQIHFYTTSTLWSLAHEATMTRRPENKI